MGWINKIAAAVNGTLNSLRPPVVSIPPILLLCEILNRPGLSAISLTSAIIARLPEIGIPAGVNVDGSANVNREVEFIFSSGVKYAIKGVQDFHDNKIDEATGTITLRATFDNPKDELIQGDFGRIIIYSNNKDELPVVPQSATMENQEGLYVYVMDENNLPRMRYIKTMGTTGDNWIVYEGLKAGDKIVMSGTQKVIPGAPVRIVAQAEDNQAPVKKQNIFTRILKKIKKIFSGKEK